jgi:hypothetical protein
MTMVSTDSPADNQFWRNDLDPVPPYLAIEVLAEVAGCPAAPIHRSDIGAVVRLENRAASTWSAAQEINGGMGHGSQASPILHFGIPDGLDAQQVVHVAFAYPGVPDAEIRITPASITSPYRLLRIFSDDADGDGIATSVEQADAIALANDDPDGDGFDSWNDADADGDGIDDAAEAARADLCAAAADANGNGTPDYLEPPDGPIPDGGPRPDGAVVMDGGGGDAGPGRVEAHGSGLVRCGCRSAGSGGGAPAWIVVVGFLAMGWVNGRARARARARERISAG